MQWLELRLIWRIDFQDEDSEAVLAADFEIGHFIRERIVPRAVLYFTGEAIEDDDDDVSLPKKAAASVAHKGCWSLSCFYCWFQINSPGLISLDKQN